MAHRITDCDAVVRTLAGGKADIDQPPTKLDL